MTQRIFVLRSREQALAACRAIGESWHPAAVAGQPVVVVLETIEGIRSTEQNKLYWSLLRDIAESAVVDGKRFASDVWHEYFKARFIGTEDINLPDGRQITRPISTTTLTKAQFSELVEKVTAYASTELNLEFF